jgi:hypothetical protein
MNKSVENDGIRPQETNIPVDWTRPSARKKRRAEH